MSIKIHPYLFARLIAVQEAFNHPGGVRPVFAANTNLAAKKGNNFKGLVKDEEGEDDQTGGRGTIRGNRGKNAVNAAAAMRKLSRSR